ncbi:MULTISPECIES: putative quorum-sensing-regulated virulence factor [Halorhodospira]|uniref:putative quorum-sensing-regulated virulence factor n=1 Tax=Halorhodospira TaxID=85108 RepID=UPI0019113322|nr:MULTISPECIES: DUF3820 family protein [Halorhodospira]MBK5943354.1 hypothetical protein [Halorhodospira halophila]MCG5526880.1 DUF3820 family protein [Halorhodospira halophila]MCG5537896.1 DUF3820 family protein [Halorhodospira sp. 9622]MCG5542783.1 DUF3820 family protein [Halorhodospira sp. 9628]
MQHVFRVVDLETTGLDPERDGICEFASVDVAVDTATGESEVIAYCQQITNPGQPIPASASAIHHLTDEDVADAPSPMDWLARAAQHPGPLVAHNAEFERAFFECHGINNATWLCTQRLAKHLLPGLESYSNQFLRYHLGLIAPGAKGMPAHRALADCYVTAALLGNLLARDHGCPSIRALIDYADQPVALERMMFGRYRGRRWEEVPTDYLRWMQRQADGWDRDTEHTLELELQNRCVTV